METKQHATKKINGSMRKIKKEIKKYLKTIDNEDPTTQNLWDATKADVREIHSNAGLPQKTRKISN